MLTIGQDILHAMHVVPNATDTGGFKRQTQRISDLTVEEQG